MEARGKGEGRCFCFIIKKKQFRRKEHSLPAGDVLVEGRTKPQRAVHPAQQEQEITLSYMLLSNMQRKRYA